MIAYLIKSGALLTLFYLFFILFMRKTTFFRFNRIVLLSGTVICMILPLVDISALEAATEGYVPRIVLPETIVRGKQLFEGKVSVPSVEYGLVQVGQTVNIKLHAYPYLEFGILQGIVSQVSSNPVEADGNLFYNVSITLPNMLTTTNGIKIPFAYKLEGIAEIEVKQRMLSDIIFEPFVMLSQKTH